MERIAQWLKIMGLAIHPSHIYELLFDDPKESPELKLKKCQELGIEVFYDDRDDVTRLLSKDGILAMQVTRKDNSTYDLGAEIK